MIVAIESYQTHKHRSKNDSGLHGRWISQTRSFSFTEGSLISDKLTIRQSIAASSSLGSHATLVLLLYDFCRPSKLPMSKYWVVTDCKSNESYPAFISSKIALKFFFGCKMFTQNRTVIGLDDRSCNLIGCQRHLANIKRKALLNLPQSIVITIGWHCISPIRSWNTVCNDNIWAGWPYFHSFTQKWAVFTRGNVHFVSITIIINTIGHCTFTITNSFCFEMIWNRTVTLNKSLWSPDFVKKSLVHTIKSILSKRV